MTRLNTLLPSLYAPPMMPLIFLTTQSEMPMNICSQEPMSLSISSTSGSMNGMLAARVLSVFFSALK